jgi:hypothetical protein
MRLTITCDVEPGDQDISEIRARLKGHASIVRQIIRGHGPYDNSASGLGIEDYVLAKHIGENKNPRLTRITWKVTNA